MQRFIALMLLVIGSSAVALAIQEAPEIDPASGANALALIAGSLVVLRSCRRT
jgi:hypothetical protein